MGISQNTYAAQKTKVKTMEFWLILDKYGWGIRVLNHIPESYTYELSKSAVKYLFKI